MILRFVHTTVMIIPFFGKKSMLFDDFTSHLYTLLNDRIPKKLQKMVNLFKSS